METLKDVNSSQNKIVIYFSVCLFVLVLGFFFFWWFFFFIFEAICDLAVK